MNDPLVLLVMVGLLSIACQFFAYKVKLPAILPLLIVGILIGPVFGALNADDLFGELLFPIVSLSVAIILFEGALTLKKDDIAGHGKMVRNLCSVGVVVTWLIAAFAAHYLLSVSWSIAFLFGAIVTVTGPTVIVPMLRSVRPNHKVANILRWEGIVIDPVGALLAVLVFEFIVSAQGALSHTFYAFGITLLTGLGFGAAAGIGLGISLKNNWIPQYLVNTAVLTVILGVFAASNVIAHESGLLTVTVAGIILANMKGVNIEGILEFKETLSVLLISGLFILLATRLDLNAIAQLGWAAAFVILAIMYIARPISVFISSWGTSLTLKELALISWIAPRGIVAAAVSALFALKLEEQGFPQSEIIVPMVFLVIITTVVVQSLTAKLVAKLLGVRAPIPNGFLLFGGNRFSQLLAKELQEQGIYTCIADTNWNAISDCRMQDIPVYFGNPMSEHASLHLELNRFGNVLILSPYRQLNPLVSFHFEDALGKGKVWGLSNNEQLSRPSHKVSSHYANKLTLFGEGITYAYLASAVAKGATVKTTRLTDAFRFEDYQETYGERAIPLVYIDTHNVFHVVLANNDFEPAAGWRLISLITPKDSGLP
ncbi:sodium:proton antiporter [Alteromonas sediminis]|uniref:Sodium:proton antiporter n=1 Tax=Alteromonas sediminis TaxID=2259342 RepID=A0A3N5Y064_9ALTE|nr:sodium:proton antiporter [Alteromonas sediminis]RPJ66410.1 sodium:proton antiporter [Alteromonas sediminis]